MNLVSGEAGEAAGASNYEIATGYPQAGWVTLRDHLAAMQDLRDRLDSERDRRYAEVGIERDKALRIKERADEVALNLARDIQVYKDEKANELRTQIERERGDYATKADVAALSDKFDAAHRPVVEFMSTYAGKLAGGADTRLNVNTVLQVLAVLITAGILYAAFHK